jgi:quercetin dioxygenase-like cupin family protein
MKEADRLDAGRTGAQHYRRALEQAKESEHKRREVLQSVIPAELQEWEDSPQGRLKHMVNDQMGTNETCLDMYQQVIEAGGRSGKHRHFSEELLFILEGSGHDLHWDPIFEPDDRYRWSWPVEPKVFHWKAGDYVRIPPYTTHQHVADPGGRARFISATLRLVKTMGYDGLEQVEPAPESAKG